MPRSFSMSTLLGAPALVAFVLLSGCAGGEEKKPDSGPVAGGVKPPRVKDKKSEELPNPTDGILKGRVVLDGATPKIELIKAMAGHTDSKTCLAADADEFEKMTQEWILAADKKGVANVVIKLLPPAGKKFKAMEPEKKEVEMDQPHCAFVPHVVALVPGQVLRVKNSAPVVHNTKIAADPTLNPAVSGVSVAIPPDKDRVFELNYQKNPVNVACDFHNWMTAKVYVHDSPYIAVTDKDGNFEMRNVPTGVELAVVGMHELGTVDGDKEGVKATFKAGENKLDLKVKGR